MDAGQRVLSFGMLDVKKEQVFKHDLEVSLFYVYIVVSFLI